MTYNPDIHHRRSIRLKGYDYSQPGMYFITVCTRNREHLFGTITVGAGSKPVRNNTPNDDSTRTGLEPAPTDMDTDVNMKLNDFGRIVENTWFDLVNHIRNIKLHAFIIMPNHIHGLIEIYNDIPVGVGSKPVRNNTPNAGRKNDIPNSPRNGVPHDGRNDSIIDEFTVGAGSKPARINTPNR